MIHTAISNSLPSVMMPFPTNRPNEPRPRGSGRLCADGNGHLLSSNGHWLAQPPRAESPLAPLRFPIQNGESRPAAHTRDQTAITPITCLSRKVVRAHGGGGGGSSPLARLVFDEMSVTAREMPAGWLDYTSRTMASVNRLLSWVAIMSMFMTEVVPKQVIILLLRGEVV